MFCIHIGLNNPLSWTLSPPNLFVLKLQPLVRVLYPVTFIIGACQLGDIVPFIENFCVVVVTKGGHFWYIESLMYIKKRRNFITFFYYYRIDLWNYCYTILIGWKSANCLALSSYLSYIRRYISLQIQYIKIVWALDCYKFFCDFLLFFFNGFRNSERTFYCHYI